VSAARVAFLGTSAALTSAARDNTSLVFEAAGTALLADCGGGTLHRLERLGVDPLGLTHVVVTHVHVDHAYGLPSLVRQLMLLGRRTPLAVVCRPEHVEPLRALLTTFRVWERPDAFALQLVPIDLAVGARAFTSGRLRVSTAPNDHGPMPNFAVRVEVGGGGAVVYSSDTQPSDNVVALSRGAGTLIHEATFLERDRPPGHAAAHSSAAEAGQVATRAGVDRLILVHVGSAYHGDVEVLAAEARQHFAGEVRVAEELGFAYF
jgi:ribonuclease Z